MNIEIADRLVKLRKEHNLSQEALASKLGLSRQAVSKWERAEASPDTDNLVAPRSFTAYRLTKFSTVPKRRMRIRRTMSRQRQSLRKRSLPICPKVKGSAAKW